MSVIQNPSFITCALRHTNNEKNLSCVPRALGMKLNMSIAAQSFLNKKIIMFEYFSTCLKNYC